MTTMHALQEKKQKKQFESTGTDAPARHQHGALQHTYVAIY